MLLDEVPKMDPYLFPFRSWLTNENGYKQTQSYPLPRWMLMPRIHNSADDRHNPDKAKHF